MAMKIGTDAFKERVSQGLDNQFMRGAVSGAQERSGRGALKPRKNWGIGKSGALYQKRSGSMSLKILIST